MSYKHKVRELIRKHRNPNKFARYKHKVKKDLGFWNQHVEKYYNRATNYVRMNDGYQKTEKYKQYRREYETDYRNNNRIMWNYKSMKSIYKKKGKDLTLDEYLK